MSRDSSPFDGRESFHTTRWSVVARASGDPREAREALEHLCTAYWYPLYAFARRRGLAHDAAQDAVQAFFARLIEKHDLSLADRSRGRFRSFLLAALSNFLANERDRERAWKRGGSMSRLSIDDAQADARYQRELAADASPEAAFERQWARELLARALSSLESEWTNAGRARLFARLKPFLTGDAGGAQSEIATELSMTENAVRIALHRMRKRYGELVRMEVADTVADPGDVEAELGQLFDALGGA